MIGADVFRITSYETGKSAPSPNRLMQLARVLECEPSYLMQTDPDSFLLAELRMSAGLTAAEVVAKCVPLLGRVGVPLLADPVEPTTLDPHPGTVIGLSPD
ncbi:helix-turn-helix transcriptional regulator [Streptomyces sp. NPDC023588]|uniref:helix-turn-helix domain-containing protein n=1 Tax=Streptomyces sp. NPDC023588 TaxID=3154907 RepID=UPI003400EB5D